MELIVRAPLSTHFTGTLVRSIGSIASPRGLAITNEGQLFIVQNRGWKGVLLYDCLGKKLGEYVPSLSKRNLSSPKGSCYYPKGVAIDKDGNFILVDTRCNRIQKFKLNPDLQKEEFLKSAGEHGNGDKQFNRPQYRMLSIHHRDLMRIRAGQCSCVPKLKESHIIRDSWTRLNVLPSKVMQVQSYKFNV